MILTQHEVLSRLQGLRAYHAVEDVRALGGDAVTDANECDGFVPWQNLGSHDFNPFQSG